MWVIDYTQEASNYAIDSHPYNEAVLMAIEDLADTEDGIPPGGCHQLEPGLCMWEVADHVVVYYRNEQERRIRIAVIKPL